MTRQLNNIIFVLITIMSASCLRNRNQMNAKYAPGTPGTTTTTTTTVVTTPNGNPSDNSSYNTSSNTSSNSQNNSNNILGSAAEFAVLCASTCTNASSPSNITGSIGVFPGSAITGINNVSGGNIASRDTSRRAQRDVDNAYNSLLNQSRGHELFDRDLGNKTLGPGVYRYGSSGALSRGTLTLDGRGDSNAQWIFQFGSTVTTATGTSVRMINGGNPFNVYWLVGSSATILGDSMCGNILAYASITLGAGVNLKGRALARVGAVTLISDNISNQ